VIFDFSTELLNWYYQNARRLPWRTPPQNGMQLDPYKVWVSEIMLQQTRVDTVIPYYLRWIDQFPNIESLARASQDEVLILWEGLGYYSRARNLHRAARLVAREFNGDLPQDVDQLLQLPGVGAYTAGAIASIAFGKDESAIDGNVRRILARFYNLTEPVGSTKFKNQIRELVEMILPSGHAGDFNQALMDLGSMVCTAHQPVCSQCPLKSECMAHALHVELKRPVKKKRKAVPHLTAAAAVISFEKKVLIDKHGDTKLLGGMWGFPEYDLQVDDNLKSELSKMIKDTYALEVQVNDLLGIYKHAYTHFRVTMHAYLCGVMETEDFSRAGDSLHWVDRCDLGNYPMGKIDRQIANSLINKECL